MTAAIHDGDSKSPSSYKSTPTSRSGVLERAREYTRKVEGEAARRAQSIERQSEASRGSRSAPRAGGNRVSTRERARASLEKDNHYKRPSPTTPNSQATQRTRDTRQSMQSRSRSQQDNGEPQEAVVSPELLVDALSGHEDGLLAIAERLMEHYDSGYDVMGEAIIDAFADVQKLFQHVVEAAHMEGAAFEASRREEEMKELRQQAGQGGFDQESQGKAASPSGAVRHDEFIDQDVKDCLTEAIRKGSTFKEQNKHMECYVLYEGACQSASSLLPVDSDHRGRLQLSIARAESMAPDRACAILRYAMDDVLRSGLRAGKIPLPDHSKRADVVLSKPKGHPSMSSISGIVQSSEEQLNSLVEELKEIMGAPVYKDTPLQEVATRFWEALAESQKLHNRNEERLEQNLAKLKGDFLLAKAEWEEKLTHSRQMAEQYKRRYLAAKEGGPTMEDARNMFDDEYGGQIPASSSNIPPLESVASLGSGLAQHARSLVGSFSCSGINEHTGGVLASELAAERENGNRTRPEWKDRRRTRNSPRHHRDANGSSRSFREFSPKRNDL